MGADGALAWSPRPEGLLEGWVGVPGHSAVPRSHKENLQQPTAPGTQPSTFQAMGRVLPRFHVPRRKSSRMASFLFFWCAIDFPVPSRRCRSPTVGRAAQSQVGGQVPVPWLRPRLLMGLQVP